MPKWNLGFVAVGWEEIGHFSKRSFFASFNRLSAQRWQKTPID